MIWFRIIWGLVLSSVLGYSFRRAWRWEHGIPNYSRSLSGKDRGTETFVLLPPTVLFWILLVFLAAYVITFGIKDGGIRFAALLIDVMFILSIYYVLLLIILPLLRKRISARACAVLWLVPAFLSWQAHILMELVPLPVKTIFIPHSVLPVIISIWLAGFIIVGGYYLFSHLTFCSYVKKHSSEENDAEILAIWEQEQEVLDYKRHVRLLRGDVPAPFSMGRTKRSRCTVLPRCEFTTAELSIIFRHELHHLQRCDVDTKVFLCLCKALCWFNPLVWIAAKKAAQDLERSCDEIVTDGMNEGERKVYAHLLLDNAALGRGCTTCLSAAAGTLRYRMKSIIEPQRRPLGTVLLMIALFTSVMCFGLISMCDAKGNFSSLVLSDDVKITRVYDSQTYEPVLCDTSGFREKLDEIELEHVAGLREYADDKESRRITFSLSDGRYATLTDKILYIRDSHYVKRRVDCFLVKSEVDMDVLFESMK